MVLTGTSAKMAHEGDILAVTFKDRFGRPIDDLAVEALLIRPTREGLDTVFALRNQGGGIYAGQVFVPLPGQRDACIHTHRRGKNFQASRRLFVP